MANRVQFIVTVDDTKTRHIGTWTDTAAMQAIADAIQGMFWNIEVEFHKRTPVIRPRVSK